jgi:hypothetical protein
LKAKSLKKAYKEAALALLPWLYQSQYQENIENYVGLIDQLKPTGLPKWKLSKILDMTAKLK